MLYKSEYDGLMSNDVWSFQVEKGKTFAYASKECVINQIVKSKVIEYGAKRIGVQIEPDEKIEIEDKAIECYEKVFKDMEGKYGITQAVVKDVMYDNYLADKVYEVATNNVDVIVKESESRVPVVKQIEVLFKGYDKDGNKIDRSKQGAHELIVEVSNKLSEEDVNFSEVALEFSDSADIDVVVNSEISDKAYRKAAVKLNEEEISDIIETSKGYYILYCAEDNDEDEQRKNIENIIIKRQDDIFAKVYYEWLEKNDIYIVSELWNMIHIQEW
jgi:foldase protein PrsA